MTDKKTSKRSVTGWMVFAVLIVAAVATWLSVRTVRGVAVETLLPALINALHGDEQRLARAVLASYEEFRGNATQWSFCHYGSTILAALLSAAAGVVIKLELWLQNEPLKKDLAATFAGLAALLITVSSTVGFERKWQANRHAAAQAENLALQLVTVDEMTRKQSLTRIGEDLRRISLSRQMDVIGPSNNDKPATTPASGPR